MALTHALSTNNYGPAHLIVATSAANGTHTTLAGAMADAVSGDTIFLRDSVTENVTLTAGVNIAAWTGGTLNTPTITGTLTMTTAGTCNVTGIRLVTNSAAVLAVTGSAASIVNLRNCYLNCTNNTGITYSSSSGSSAINVMNCSGDLGTTGIGYFTDTSSGILRINGGIYTNTGASSTASTTSAGSVLLEYIQGSFPVSSSSSGAFGIVHSALNSSSTNTTSLTTAGTGVSTALYSSFTSGSASAISIGAGTTVVVYTGVIDSTNTNAITGSGVIDYASLVFSNTSSTINTTTQTISGTLQGSKNTAPTAGFLGQNIVATASAVATTANTAKTIASIVLTPGVWDVSAFAGCIPTGGTGLLQIFQVGISTTDNTITGTLGIEFHQFNIAAGSSTIAGAVPQYRILVTTNTTYYLVVANFYTSTTCPTNGRISATRVG